MLGATVGEADRRRWRAARARGVRAGGRRTRAADDPRRAGGASTSARRSRFAPRRTCSRAAAFDYQSFASSWTWRAARPMRTRAARSPPAPRSELRQRLHARAHITRCGGMVAWNHSTAFSSAPNTSSSVRAVGEARWTCSHTHRSSRWNTVSSISAQLRSQCSASPRAFGGHEHHVVEVGAVGRERRDRDDRDEVGVRDDRRRREQRERRRRDERGSDPDAAHRAACGAR